MTTQKNRALCLASLLLTLALFAGCTTDPIFSAIEDEVKLKDPTMTGIVTSFEIVGTDLYAANGYIYNRTNGTGSWSKISLPSSGIRCPWIASDGTNLYALFTKSDDWTDFDSVQRYSGSSWTKVTAPSGVQRIGSGDGRIYAFTKNGDDNWNAYATASAGGMTFSLLTGGTSITTPTSTAGNFVATNAKVYYCDGSSLSEAGSSPSGVTGITIGKNAGSGTTDYLYAVNSGYAYRYDSTTGTSGTWTSLAHSVDTPTANISYLRPKNLLLIASGSTGSGYEEIQLTSAGAFSSNLGTPGESTASSIGTDTNYDSSVGLRALYRIDVVDALNNSGSVPAGNDYVIYASVVHYSYGGLWSYYPGTDPEWNRE
jgi:hypothetical protein